MTLMIFQQLILWRLKVSSLESWQLIMEHFDLLRNQLKIALFFVSKLPVLNFYSLVLLSFSSEFKSFSLFLTQVDKVLLRTPYLAAIPLLLISFSKSLTAWDLSRNVLRVYIRFPLTNMFKCEWQKKDKQMIVYGTVTIHNINKIELSNVKTFKSKCKYHKLWILLDS